MIGISPWCPLDLNADVEPPIVFKAIGIESRAAPKLRAAVEQFEGQGRYIHRNVDGKPGDETFCNFFVRDALRALGVEVPRLRAHDLGSFMSQSASWREVPQWMAIALAELGFPVVAWMVKSVPVGHVAMVVPSRTDTERGMVHIAQAGLSNFVYGSLQQGFGAHDVKFFAHQ